MQCILIQVLPHSLNVFWENGSNLCIYITIQAKDCLHHDNCVCTHMFISTNIYNFRSKRIKCATWRFLLFATRGALMRDVIFISYFIFIRSQCHWGFLFPFIVPVHSQSSVKEWYYNDLFAAAKSNLIHVFLLQGHPGREGPAGEKGIQVGN